MTHLRIKYEFMALVEVGKEVEWLRNLLSNIKVVITTKAIYSLNCDKDISRD